MIIFVVIDFFPQFIFLGFDLLCSAYCFWLHIGFTLRTADVSNPELNGKTFLVIGSQ